MKKHTWKERFVYWFDKQMAKGTSHLLTIIAAVILCIVLLSAVMITVLHLSDGTFLESLWNLFASTINAWMPYADDGGAGYVLLSAVSALVGLLFTSVLIGVVSNAIEEKIASLRRGKTPVLAEQHVILLGFESGQYEMINQLILAAEDEDRTILVCDEMARDEMEDDIRKNVEIPKNIEVLCRNINIEDPADLAMIEPQKARVIVVNVMRDDYAIKTTMAILQYLREYPDSSVRVISNVSTSRYLLPETILQENNCTMVRTNDFITKLIAHTGLERGLSSAYLEFLRFEGEELYIEYDEEVSGMTVLELTACLNRAVLLGIVRNGKAIINPSRDFVIRSGDGLLMLEQAKDAYEIETIRLKQVDDRPLGKIRRMPRGRVLIFGYNYKLETLIAELPDDARRVTLVNEKERDEINIEHLGELFPDVRFTKENCTYFDMQKLEDLVRLCDHILIITNDDAEPDEDDINNTLLMMRLAEIRKHLGLRFHITTELHKESSYNLVMNKDSSDFVIASNYISMILAQLSEQPELYEVFKHLLSNKGNELFCKPIEFFNLEEREYSVSTLKQILLSYGYTLLGYRIDHENILNPPLYERIALQEDTTLIVLGRR